MPEIVLNGCMISYQELGSGPVKIVLTAGGRWADDLAALIQERLLAMNPIEFVRRMALWRSYFNTSGGLPIAGCRLSDDEWASIKVPASITGGVDPTHPTEVAQRLAKLLPKARCHAPVVTDAEWDANFSSSIPYPITANFQGERIAPVWRDFIRRVEA